MAIYPVNYQIQTSGDYPLDSKSMIESLDDVFKTVGYVGMIFSTKDDNTSMYKVTEINEKSGYITAYIAYVTSSETSTENAATRNKVKALEAQTTSQDAIIANLLERIKELEEVTQYIFRPTSKVPSSGCVGIDDSYTTVTSGRVLPFNSNYFYFNPTFTVVSKSDPYGTRPKWLDDTNLELETQICPTHDLTCRVDFGCTCTQTVYEESPGYGYSRESTDSVAPSDTYGFDKVKQYSPNLSFTSYVNQKLDTYDGYINYNKAHNTNLTEEEYWEMTAQPSMSGYTTILNNGTDGFSYVIKKGTKINLDEEEKYTFYDLYNSYGGHAEKEELTVSGFKMNIPNEIIYGFIPKTGITICNDAYKGTPSASNTYAWKFPIIHHHDAAQDSSHKIHIFSAQTYNDIFSLTDSAITYDDIVYVRNSGTTTVDGVKVNTPCNTYYRILNLNEPHPYCYIKKRPQMVFRNIASDIELTVKGITSGCSYSDFINYEYTIYRDDTARTPYNNSYTYTGAKFYDIASKTMYKVTEINETTDEIYFQKDSFSVIEVPSSDISEFVYNKSGATNTVICTSVGDLLVSYEGNTVEGFTYTIKKVSAITENEHFIECSNEDYTLVTTGNSYEEQEFVINGKTYTLVGTYDTHTLYYSLVVNDGYNDIYVDAVKNLSDYGNKRIAAQQGMTIMTYEYDWAWEESSLKDVSFYEVISLDRRHDIDLWVNDNNKLNYTLSDNIVDTLDDNFTLGYHVGEYYAYTKDDDTRYYKLKTAASAASIAEVLTGYTTFIIPDIYTQDTKTGKFNLQYTSKEYLEKLTQDFNIFRNEVIGCSNGDYHYTDSQGTKESCLGNKYLKNGSSTLKNAILALASNPEQFDDYDKFIFVDKDFTDFRLFTNFSEIVEEVKFTPDENGNLGFVNQNTQVKETKSEIIAAFSGLDLDAANNIILYYAKNDDIYMSVKAKQPNVWCQEEGQGLVYVDLDSSTIQGGDSASVEDFANFDFNPNMDYIIGYQHNNYDLSVLTTNNGRIRSVELLNGNLSELEGDSGFWQQYIGNNRNESGRYVSVTESNCHVIDDYYEIGAPIKLGTSGKISDQDDALTPRTMEFLIASCLQGGLVLEDGEEDVNLFNGDYYTQPLLHYVVHPKGKFSIQMPSDSLDNFLFFIAMPGIYGTIQRGHGYYASWSEDGYFGSREEAEQRTWGDGNEELFTDDAITAMSGWSQSNIPYNPHFGAESYASAKGERIDYGRCHFFDLISSKYTYYDTHQMISPRQKAQDLYHKYEIFDDVYLGSNMSGITTTYESYDDTSYDQVGEGDVRFTEGSLRCNVAEFDSLKNMYINTPTDEFRLVGQYRTLDGKVTPCIDWVRYGKSLEMPSESTGADTTFYGWRYQLYGLENWKEGNKHIKNSADKLQQAVTLVTPWLLEGEDDVEMYVHLGKKVTSLNDILGCGLFFNVTDSAHTVDEITEEIAIELINKEYKTYYQTIAPSNDPQDIGFSFYKGQLLFVFGKDSKQYTSGVYKGMKYKLYKVVNGDCIQYGTINDFSALTEIEVATIAESPIKKLQVSGSTIIRTFEDAINYLGDGNGCYNKTVSNCPLIITISDDMKTLPRFAFANKVKKEENLNEYEIANNSLTEIYLPYEINQLEDYCFISCRKVTYIFITTSINSIPFGAYKDCRSLVRISLSHAIDYVDSDAFKGCSALTEVYAANVDSDVLKIKENAFSGTQITSIYATDNITAESDAFGHTNNLYATAGGSHTLIEANCNISNAEVDSTTKIIDNGAFQGCSNLLTVNWNDLIYLTKIGLSAFESCSQLNTIDFSNCNNLALIDSYAFQHDTSITSITWNKVPLTLNSYSFNACGLMGTESNPFVIPSNLTLSTLCFGNNDGIEYAKYEGNKIGGLTYCKNLQTVDLTSIDNDVIVFQEMAFKECTALSTIKFNEKYDVDNYSAYNYYANRGSNDYPNLLKLKLNWYQASNVFAYCRNLSQDLIQKLIYMGLEYDYSIPSGAFEGCTQITRLKLPYDIREIGDGAFLGCRNLRTFDADNTETDGIVLTSLMNEIASNLFGYCTSLQQVSVQGILGLGFNYMIGGGSFYGDTSLTSFTLTVDKQVHTVGTDKSFGIIIGDGAFFKCPLKVFEIGEDNNQVKYVKEIQREAFESAGPVGSHGNIDLSQYVSLTSIGYEAFWNSSMLSSTSVVLPQSLLSISDYGLATNITEVTVPQNVIEIGYGAFGYNCVKVTSQHVLKYKFVQAFKDAANTSLKLVTKNGKFLVRQEVFDEFKSEMDGEPTTAEVYNEIKECLGLTKWTIEIYK